MSLAEAALRRAIQSELVQLDATAGELNAGDLADRVMRRLIADGFNIRAPDHLLLPETMKRA